MYWRHAASAPRELPSQDRLFELATDDGRILFADAFYAVPELGLYDPVSGRFAPGPELGPRRRCALALDDDGRLLSIGGRDRGESSSACHACALAGGEWEPFPALLQPREGGCALRLRSGEVLVVGGRLGQEPLRTSECYDADEGRWRALPELPRAPADRDLHMLELFDGRVLVYASSSHQRRHEQLLFDPHARRWTRIGFQIARGARLLALESEPHAALMAGPRGVQRVHIDPESHRPTRSRVLPRPWPELRSGEHPSLHFVGGLLVLATNLRAAVMPVEDATAWFAGGCDPSATPAWQSLALPRPLEQRILDRTLIPERPVAPVGPCYLSAGSELSLIDPSVGKVWRARFNHERRDPGLAGFVDGESVGWEVLADWLEARGDPRGRRLALELVCARDLEPELRARLDAELARTPAPLTALDLELEELVERSAALELEREHGFVLRARVRAPTFFDQRAGDELPTPLALLAEAPCAALLHELALERSTGEGRLRLDEYLAQLEQLVDLPPITSLRIGPATVPEDFRPPAGLLARLRSSWTPPESPRVGSLAAVGRLAATLRRLRVTGAALEFEETSLPKLKHLGLRTPALDVACLRALARSRLPALVDLELWLGPQPTAGHALIQVLDAHGPALRSLGVHNGPEHEAWLPALLRSARARALERLDLSANALDNRAGAVVLDNSASLTSLELLDLRGNRFGPRLRRALLESFGNRVRL